jgi:glycosyltransferase involved in cell wall biosynthesis
VATQVDSVLHRTLATDTPAPGERRHIIPFAAAAALPRGGGPLRIAHFMGECAPDSANGVERSVWALSRAQSTLGHAVAMFVLQDAAGRRRGDRGAATSMRALTFAAGAIRLATGRGVPSSLLDELQRWRPSIVHLHSLHVPENIALAAKLRAARIPYAVTVHGALAPAARRRGRLRKMLLHTLCERAYLDGAAMIHALTEDEQQAIRRCGVHGPVIVAPNGVDTQPARFPSGTGALEQVFPQVKGRRVFLFIGRLDPEHKGLDLLIDGFARAGLRDAVLILAGPDWRGSRMALEQEVARRGLRNDVLFAGPVFGEAKRVLLAACDVFVHTSRWEGVSMAVLEAAVAAKPCLVTAAADPAGVLARHGAALVAEADAGSIATALRQFQDMDPSALGELGARAQGIVEATFSWPTVAAQVVDGYRAAAGAGAPS